MNAPFDPPPRLMATALSRLAALLKGGEDTAWTVAAPLAETRLTSLALRLHLSEGEVLAVALCFAAEADAGAARLIARSQAPVGGPRPLVGLLASLFAPEGLTNLGLAAGRAVATGLLRIGDEPLPLPERSISLPLPIAAALSGTTLLPEGVRPLACGPTALPERVRQEAIRHAAALSEDTMLLIRAACPREGAAMASAVAEAVGLKPHDVTDTGTEPIAAWLAAANALPVLSRTLGPGDTLNVYPPEDHPFILIASADGHFTSSRRTMIWRPALPDEAERTTLWINAGLSPDLAPRAAQYYRHGTGRIAELADHMRERDQEADDWTRLTRAIGEGVGRLDMLARRSHAPISRSDIVLPDHLGLALDRLRQRITLRNRLADPLGPTLTARYRPGVRALFTGDSGTGKTLAAHWLAEEAGLPLYRVDLSTLTSKYIGETEKNLSQLLDTAEQADVMLFFDEADSLFGARTDVGSSHDRYANAQTNFLLQRIEDYDGVALLATNSRDRFDPAFVRRLDAILEFPLPDAAARRELWLGHLGGGSNLDDDALNRLATEVDLAGGHIRNIVLGAAVRAQTDKRTITLADLRDAATEEYGKLGRAPPPFGLP